ncbi:hypothetical protein N0K08_18460 [Acidovorax sp. Be4]|uniref:Uncharacterized protein n=1 Tax=Acidovorax bellezanensis TaxID=2976702 RepID=A0ABT2PU04_9BURK|nr:hypothetical protein [Acidovorax sp. Be4]MCT9812618.1 hypothetical protein [Acidovorax sp. Be4]
MLPALRKLLQCQHYALAFHSSDTALSSRRPDVTIVLASAIAHSQEKSGKSPPIHLLPHPQFLFFIRQKAKTRPKPGLK